VGLSQPHHVAQSEVSHHSRVTADRTEVSGGEGDRESG
jgi:hypothetical protein